MARILSIIGENAKLDVRDVADCHHGGVLLGCSLRTLSAQRICDAEEVLVEVVQAILCFRGAYA